MNHIVIHPSYFPSISHFVALSQADKITFEMDDNYQKQTNRNRMFIYSPNGIQLLNIPNKQSKEAHQKTRDVKLETAFDWQKQHFKSLEAAYRSSPFFEYFEDEIAGIFQKKHTFLIDLNFETIEMLAKCLRMDLSYSKTEEFFREGNGLVDFRHLTDGKKDKSAFESYPQVFQEKEGFLNNL